MILTSILICLAITLPIAVYFIMQQQQKKLQQSQAKATADYEALQKASAGYQQIVNNLQAKENDLQANWDKLLAEKKSFEEQNKSVKQFNTIALEEKQRLEELNAEVLAEKEKIETQKKKYDDKIKKLWQQSTAIHKEKERISELHQNLAIEKQKSEKLLGEIQLKNKEITDNINYALRIQTAILPNITHIYKVLTQSFILYMPKDIVSGDFFGFAEKNNKVIIIAADCTGHGVSGAFMSMIGSSLLNQIINEKAIVQPAQILNLLSTSIIDALNQSETESNDGMDVSICSFDLDTLQLEYAGANRPLWVIRDYELLTYSPNKYPIGGLQMARDRQFTNQTIQLQKNDTFYIFTDGYADQFGGEKGKKLMTSKFKELLLSPQLQQTPMQAQEPYLKNFFNQWQGEHEQVDDVLVIGVRV